MAELKFKMAERAVFFLNTFNFSSDTRGHFSNVNTFWHLWPLGQQNAPQIFEEAYNNFKAVMISAHLSHLTNSISD